jgi:hypothetical protein
VQGAVLVLHVPPADFVLVGVVLRTEGGEVGEVRFPVVPAAPVDGVVEIGVRGTAGAVRRPAGSVPQPDQGPEVFGRFVPGAPEGEERPGFRMGEDPQETLRLAGELFRGAEVDRPVAFEDRRFVTAPQQGQGGYEDEYVGFDPREPGPGTRPRPWSSGLSRMRSLNTSTRNWVNVRDSFGPCRAMATLVTLV